MRPLRRFGADASATSAIEFALVLPILATLALGSIELQRYQRLSGQLLAAAENVADLVAQRETNQADPLTFDFDIARQVFPQAAIENPTSWRSSLSHQISHAVFVPTVANCVRNCVYRAELAWNWPTYEAGPGAGDLRRQCGLLTATPNSARQTGATLPESMFASGSIVIVDLRYSYSPMFGAAFFQPMVIERQGYSFPRFASPYVKVPGTQTTKCSGYS